MARRTKNRMELRAEHEAFERRKEEEEREEDEEEEEGEDEEEEGEEDEEAGAAEEDGEAGDEDEEEEAPKKKKAVKAKAPPKPRSRARAAKVVRRRVVWGVFNNSHQMVASYEYPRRTEADQHAARLTADKRSTHFVQPVKEAIEEKKDKEKEK